MEIRVLRNLVAVIILDRDIVRIVEQNLIARLYLAENAREVVHAVAHADREDVTVNAAEQEALSL